MKPVYIHVEESAGLERPSAPVRLGVPLPRGALRDAHRAALSDEAGGAVPAQYRTLAQWSDGSIKWLQLDALVSIAAGGKATLALNEIASALTPAIASGSLSVQTLPDRIEVQTGVAAFSFLNGGSGLPDRVTTDRGEVLANRGAAVRLLDAQGREHVAVFDRARIEESGPVRAVILWEGTFRTPDAALNELRLQSRVTLTAASAAVSIEFIVHNPRAARHFGGTWDLGDAGSILFREIALALRPAEPAQRLRWYADPAEPAFEQPVSAWALYQDSSGGENWNSENHVDAAGKSTVVWRGYRVSGAADKAATSGERATPALLVAGATNWIAASVTDFWQNFPKALRWQDGELTIGLFPRESAAPFELQGGERKRHTVYLDFGATGDAAEARCGGIGALQQSLAAWVDPADIEASGAVSYFVPRAQDGNSRYLQYLQQIVDGPRSFFARRELIDEYGWRNFGDLYADHEAVNHKGPRPMVSHYNNQYDFVYGAFIQFLRTGDARWLALMTDAARHHMDIDVYRTTQDRAAFNGGLFWHTDHYKPASTCTHRTYSGANGPSGSYGGGPSNEHNYTSGFLHYYYLTGDVEAAGTVTMLADWVIALDDGESDLLGLVDSGFTGRASQTVVPDYHRPGRGAGNSINALLDAYALTGDRRYMVKAEQLIQRCIHPEDDVEALGLGQPEYRWSYLVFLQVLAKYLDTKQELGESDYSFQYARESLLHYARWMAANERPYKDLLDRVELPTETWPAHDVRKCHVLHAAAKYSPAVDRARLHERADFFFERCIEDVLSFETAYLARPLVILSVYGHVQAYFQKHRELLGTQEWRHAYRFGRPQAFVPQRQRVKASIASKSRLLAREIARIGRDKIHLIKRRLTG